MEHRIILTDQEAFELMGKLKFVRSYFVKDEFTGTKRIRSDESGVREKDYVTLVTGVFYRFTALCELGYIKKIWFEHKWTRDKSRFEIEFEDEVPDEYKGRDSIKGWDILR